MSRLEEIFKEAVTSDRSQVVLSVGAIPDAFDTSLDRVLQQQMELDKRGVVRSWIRTQLHPIIRTPETNPIGVFYGQMMELASPETLGGLDFIGQQWDSKDPIVEILVKISKTLTSRDSTDYTERVHLRQLLFTYLIGESTPDELTELGFEHVLEDIESKLFVMGIVLRCMIGIKAKIGTNGDVGPASRLYLILDEIEHLLNMSRDISWAFIHWLKHLSSDVDGLTIWMNIKDGSAVKLVEQRLGRNITWITHSCLT